MACTSPPEAIRKHIQHTPYEIQVVAGSDLTIDPEVLAHVKAAHIRCFPDEVPESGYESMEQFLDRITWMTEPQDCTWYLLWHGVASKLKLVGLATTVPYTKSLYGFNLGVDPSFRKRGLGGRLMHEAQLEAIRRGSLCVL